MSDIPDWAFEEADKLFDPVTTPASSKHVREIIARAFVAERERCAKIAETMRARNLGQATGSAYADGHFVACQRVAFAIRQNHVPKPDNDDFKSVPHQGEIR